MKIIFFGTPEFAVPFIDTLYNDKEIDIQAVVTQPDKEAGRKKTLTPPPVKIKAAELGISVLQPIRLKNNPELINLLKGLKADFFVVIAYGKIIPEEILEIPKYGTINVHGSLLPKYRGASPIQSAILNGDKETGLSIIKINEELDAGDIYLLKKDAIKDDDTYATLAERLSIIGSIMLPAALKDIYNGILTPIPQNESKATKCIKFTKSDALIDPSNDDAEKIYNKLRAFTPWPGIYFNFKGKRIKILKALLFGEEKNINPGEFNIDNKELLLGTKKGILKILEIQPEGKKPMQPNEFINGFLR
jgi:methionyl-tRNA formyltransferase